MKKRDGKFLSVTVKVQGGLGAQPPENLRYIGVKDLMKSVTVKF